MPKKYLILIFAFMVTFSACSKQKASPAKAAQQPPQAATAAPQPAIEEPRVEREVIIYNAQGRRDPFQSLADVARSRPARKKNANPIENFDVEEIRVFAIVSDSKQHYAMVILPDGKSYTIRAGTVLGLYGGKVEEINNNKVLIREKVKDVRGELKTKDTILRLRKEEE